MKLAARTPLVPLVSLFCVLGTAGASALVAACVAQNNPPATTCTPNANAPSSFLSACPDASFPQEDAALPLFDAGVDATADATTAPDAAPDAVQPPVDAGILEAAPPPPACKGVVTTDPSFGVQGIVNDPGAQDSYTTIAVQADGKYLVSAGTIAARYNTDGSIDTSFGTGGYADYSASVYVSTFLPQPNGNVIVGGYGGPTGCGVTRIAPSGALDPTFGTDGGFATCSDFSPKYGSGFDVLAQRPNGYIVAAGPSFNVSASLSDMGVMQFDPNGILDPGFGSAGKALAGFTVTTEPNAILLQPDGKLLLVGATPVNVEAGQGHDDLLVARLNVDGSPDTTFGTGGRVRLLAPGAGPAALGLQSTGAILVVIDGSSTFHGFLVERLTPDGAVDATFGNAGTTETMFNGLGDVSNGVAVYADDTFVLDGYAGIQGDAGFSVYQPALARYSAQGVLDTTFGTGGKLVVVLPEPFDQGNSIGAQALLPNGAIVAVGGAGYLDDAGDNVSDNGLLVKFGCP